MSTDADDPAVDKGFAEIFRFYEPWRKAANLGGIGPYDEPDWDGGRLYFRSDYSAKVQQWPEWANVGEWGAWIIAPTPEGDFGVLHSLLHERASQRSESLEAVFSHSVDAGKYVILQIGDSLRGHLGLQTLFVRWDDRGLNSLIRVEPADPQTIDRWNREAPTMKRDFAKQYLNRYSLKDDAGRYGFALPSEVVNMEVLALSFDELTAALLEGMPRSITSHFDHD